MNRRAREPLRPRAYRVRQPIPRRHDSPALLHIAGVQSARAEQAVHEKEEWQRLYLEKNEEFRQVQTERDSLRADAEEERRRHEQSERQLRRELEQARNEQRDCLSTQQRQHEEQLASLRAESQRRQEELLAELRDQEQSVRESAEESLLQEHEATLVAKNEELQQLRGQLEQLREERNELQTQLKRSERAHQEVSAVADSQRRTIRMEQAQRRELEKQLDAALTAPKPTPQQGQTDSLRDYATAAEHRAKQLAIENARLRQHRDDVAHERERLSNRILRIMSPGQYLEHAASAGYDPTKDPLIQQKLDELRILDRYSRWQRLFMQRVTARRLKGNRTLDEQAIEAALTDRWKLVTKPLVSLGSDPTWQIVGFILDEDSELFLRKQSIKRSRKMVKRMAGRG